MSIFGNMGNNFVSIEDVKKELSTLDVNTLNSICLACEDVITLVVNEMNMRLVKEYNCLTDDEFNSNKNDAVDSICFRTGLDKRRAAVYYDICMDIYRKFPNFPDVDDNSVKNKKVENFS